MRYNINLSTFYETKNKDLQSRQEQNSPYIHVLIFNKAIFYNIKIFISQIIGKIKKYINDIRTSLSHTVKWGLSRPLGANQNCHINQFAKVSFFLIGYISNR